MSGSGPGALAAPGGVAGGSDSTKSSGALEPKAVPLDLLAALAAARWLGRDFMNSETWCVALWSVGDGSRGGVGNTSRHH